MKRAFPSILLGALLATACTDDAPVTAPASPSLLLGVGNTAWVTNNNNAGPGSFRAAVEHANANSRTSRVAFRIRQSTVALMEPVVYTGTQSLNIDGNDNTLDGASLIGTETNFLANGGGDLSITSLTVANAPGSGMLVQVPPTATGVQKVSLIDVSALNNWGHGIEINDQEDPEDAGDPDNGIRGNPNGSNASLNVSVLLSKFIGNGFGALDRDGLRINEGGNGNLVFSFTLSEARSNGADGVELDERGNGDVKFSIIGSSFSFNGDFDQSADPDKDDGIDVDESDAGSLIGSVLLSSANDNFEEGFDFNENDAGDFRVDMTGVEANRNVEEGIDFEEDDDWQGGGDLITRLVLVRADGNGPGGDGGLKIRERGEGDLEAHVTRSITNGNLNAGISMREQQDGHLIANIQNAVSNENGSQGIFLREDDNGSLTANVSNAESNGNAGHGMDFDENRAAAGDVAGDLTVKLRNSTANNNTGAGIRADQQMPPGVGLLQFIKVVLLGNGSATAGNVPPT